MTVKVLFLKTGQFLISEIDERPDEDTDCILINPNAFLGLHQSGNLRTLFHALSETDSY